MDAACVCHNFPPRLPARELRTCWVTLKNVGPQWDPASIGIAVDLDGHRLTVLDLPHPVPSGSRVTLSWVFRTPDAPADHVYAFQVVDRHDPAREPLPVLQAPVAIVAAVGTTTARLRDRILETHARCWMPCDGMSWSSDAAGYPHFAKAARGCRITDVEGRQFVDYLMGWGCALLGYANERIQRAVQEALGSAAILTLTHHLMPEVADLLCERFESAQAVTFGKNGSDVCTAAVRMARANTGRRIVLVSGYHGWQDWYVERFGMSATGVPETGPLVFQFPPNNLDELGRLLTLHRGDVAAVMLEPAGVIEGFAGPVRDADPAFLTELIAMAHREGALVIFDEIMTGFRYPGGSVQHATRTRPDLTCLGKGLASGMPLSALIGRRDVFDSAIARISYEPTFKGEVYSLAAAREALFIYGEQDVPALISQFGERLRSAVNGTCQTLGLDAEVLGPPFRMLLAFHEPDPRRRALMRTLVQQELFKNGVLTTQLLLLPSAAHDADALTLTTAAFERSLTVLSAAMRDDRFAAYLEIPPLPG